MSDPLSLVAAATERPDAAALVTAEGTFTYEALAEVVRERAAALAEGPVVLQPRATAEDVVTLLAAVHAKRPLVLIHPREQRRERARRLALLEDAPIPEGTLALLFTSGTTGDPKAAVLPRRAFAAALEASAARLGWRPDDRWALWLPPAHVGGLSIPLRCIQGRAAVVLRHGPFDAAEAIDAIAAERITLLSLVPTMLGRMLDAGWTAPTHLRAALIGGAPLDAALRRRALEAGVPIRPTYGMTETCAQLATAADALEPGVGRPLPGMEVAIRDSEIVVRGPALFAGYLGEAPPFDEAGWFATGDAGWLDDEGRLHVLGRLDDRILSGGENVDPLEVERALEAHPAIAEAAVFGRPDPEWGQRVAALIVRAGDGDAAAALAEVNRSLAGHRRVREAFEAPSIPRTAGGKKRRGACEALARETARLAGPRLGGR